MLTGDMECPQEIQCVHQIEHLIASSVASGAVCDNELDDKVIDISSDDSCTVGTKWKWIAVTSECTALLSRKSGVGGVSDSGFSLCTVPTYYCRSEYFYNQCPQVQNLIGTECSLNRSECRFESKAS